MTDDPRVPMVEAVEAALDGAEPVVVATVVTAGEIEGLPVGAKLLVHRDGSRVGAIDGGAVDELVVATANEAFTAFPRVPMQTLYVHRAGGSATRRSEAQPGDAELMVQLYEAPARLLIVGGGHVGLAIAQVAEIAGFDITVLDDRPDFANRERFPMAEHVVCGEIDEELRDLPLGPSAFIVLVSRGHQVDELALREVVGREAAYVGMIGSRRRTATVIGHLVEEGLDEAALRRVRTPIGLDIGAETPEEIAVSIVGEMILERRGGGGGRPLSSLGSRRAEDRV